MGILLAMNTQNPPIRNVKRAVEELKSGGIIVYPTDTTYAFGCDLFDKHAVEKILSIKRMPKDKLLSLICPDLKTVSQYGFVSNQSYKLMKRCLPGPYTFVLKATQLVPRIMMTRQKTIGVRMPQDNIALAIVTELGHPIITASVALPGEEAMSEPYEINARLGHVVEVVIDAGIILPNPSTIVDLSVEPPVIIREGKGDVSFITEME